MSTNSLQLTLKALFVDEVNPSTTSAYSPQPGLSLSINTNPKTHKINVYIINTYNYTTQITSITQHYR